MEESAKLPALTALAYSQIGMLVVFGNTTERILNCVITFVIQDGEELTVDRLMKLEKQYRKFTLGRIIECLRARASFDPSIEIRLTRFLDNRNTLMHRFQEIPGANMDTQAEVLDVLSFIGQTVRDMHDITIFAMGLIHAWGLEQSFPDFPDVKNYGIEQQMLGKIIGISSEISSFVRLK